MKNLKNEKISGASGEDFFFMREALREALDAFENDEIPVGAILVKEGSVIGRGRNRRRERMMPLAHAEIIAIEDAGQNLASWRFDGCTMYVTLEPCPMCAGAIIATRVSRVVYGAPDPRAGAAGTLYDILRDPRIPHRCEVAPGILSAESSELLGKFFRTRRNISSGER